MKDQSHGTTNCLFGRLHRLNGANAGNRALKIERIRMHREKQENSRVTTVHGGSKMVFRKPVKKTTHVLYVGPSRFRGIDGGNTF